MVTSFNAEFRTAALRNFAYRRFYPKLDSVVCQSEDMRDDLVERLGFDAVSVAGGTSGWAADGRTIVTGSTP